MLDSVSQIQNDMFGAILTMESAHNLGQTVKTILKGLRQLGMTFEICSIYLKQGASDVIHYYLYPLPVGYEKCTLNEIEEVFDTYGGQRRTTWQNDIASGVNIPTSVGILKLSRNGTPYTEREIAILTALANMIVLIAVRHQDLLEKEKSLTNIEELDRNLLAVHDASANLFSHSQREIVEKIVHLTIQTLGFDRCGIFLKDDSRGVLQGQLGINPQGEIEDISRTVYPLVPSRSEETTTMCQIALGERPFFLTQNLDGEGYQTEEGNVFSHASVPMKVGEKILGVLCVDNYFSRQPIDESQLLSLMVLANQGGNALDRLAAEEELKQAQESIRLLYREVQASLKEKEVLLKEVHHRVKNNLQVMSSLINLQTRYTTNEQLLQTLKEIQNRIQSMALIHEKLHQSEDLARIDFSEYIQSLTAYLYQTYGVQSADVTLKSNVDDIFLDIDTAVPCGLIVNELVSNALKHAFPAGSGVQSPHNRMKSEVRIDFYSDTDNQLTLIVNDNGVGFPQDLDFRNTKSLGLRLVVMLTEQLDGTIKLDRSDGTKFEMTLRSKL